MDAVQPVTQGALQSPAGGGFRVGVSVSAHQQRTGIAVHRAHRFRPDRAGPLAAIAVCEDRLHQFMRGIGADSVFFIQVDAEHPFDTVAQLHACETVQTEFTIQQGMRREVDMFPLRMNLAHHGADNVYQCIDVRQVAGCGNGEYVALFLHGLDAVYSLGCRRDMAGPCQCPQSLTFMLR